MKSDFLYSLFVFFFRLGRLLPLRERRAVLLSPHNEGFEDSLGAVGAELERDGFEVCRLSGARSSGIMGAARFMTVGAAGLARAKYVFLNDNFTPLPRLDFRSEAVVVQLWHAEGAFKKFALSTALTESAASVVCGSAAKLSGVVCSSEGVVPIYAEAFGVPEEKVLPLGAPRCDAFFGVCDAAAERRRFDSEYPGCAGKKLILYAPTFRDDAAADARLLDAFDFERFNAEMGEEYALLVRLHPQVRAARIPERVTDVTGFGSFTRLASAADMLITDYSSVCMDFALLGKPCVFYAFDLDTYAGARQFYFDYESYVPGPVAMDFDTLINAVKNPGDYDVKRSEFVRFNFGSPDGHAARRVVKHFTGQK